MQDVEDEPLFAERVAGIDIAKAGIEVAVRVPSDTTAGRRQQETRLFRTTRKELLALADWLRSWGVTKVGMESTGATGSRSISCSNARAWSACCITPRRSRRCPGGPRQAGCRMDSEDHRAGQPALQLRAPQDIRRLRTHTRYRRTLTQVRTAEMQRVEKLLEEKRT